MSTAPERKLEEFVDLMDDDGRLLHKELIDSMTKYDDLVKSIIKHQENKIAAKEMTITEKDSEIALKNRLIEEKDREIEELRFQVASLQAAMQPAPAAQTPAMKEEPKE